MRICQQCHVGILDGRIDTHDLRVRFCIHETWVAVTSVTPDASADAVVLFVQHNAKGHMERIQSQPSEIIV